jgi:GT2 family glycosyltransferase
MLATRTPPVLVVLLNWNRAQDTVECIQSLLASTYPVFTIMVCDNASQQEDFESMRTWAEEMQSASRLSFRVMPRAQVEKGGTKLPAEQLLLVKAGENLGFAAGNNIGLRYAINGDAYEYVWILNNDAIVDRNALTHLVDALERDPALAAVGSNLFSYDQPGELDSLGGGPFNATFGIDTPYGEDVEMDDGMVNVDHIIGTSMLVRTSVVRSVGLMDERYFLYREETDWCLRMRNHGWRLACSTRSAVWHKCGATVGRKTPTHDYYSVRNMLWLIKRYSPATLPTAETYTLLRAILPKIVRLEFGRMRSVLKAFVDFHRGVTGKVDLSGLGQTPTRAHSKALKAPSQSRNS